MIKKTLTISLICSSILFATEINSKQQTSIGVEINPLSFLSFNKGNDTIFSGELSYFDNGNATEMALSLAYEKTDTDFIGYSNYFGSKAMNIALHYRKFVSKRTKGFYYGGFGSYTYLNGKLKDDPQVATVRKLGLGAEIGVRLMKPYSDWSFYWGPALRMGAYLNSSSNNGIFDSNSLGMALYDKNVFIDIDFMRIGLRF